MATLIQLEDTAAESPEKKNVLAFSVDARELLRLQPDRYIFVKRLSRGKQRISADSEAQITGSLGETDGRGGARD